MSVFRNLYCLSAVTAVALALAGCAPETLPPPDGSVAASSPTTGGPLSGTPEPDSLADGSNQKITLPEGVTRYECGDGSTIEVRYPDIQTAIVNYKKQDHPMKIAKSGNGKRYVGSEYQWVTRGSGRTQTATLYGPGADSATGTIVASCTVAE